ncbi:hypothetical protein CTAYLR_009795 [Chrysophaeum taylorii]|uniref:Uncharacterized protein n=1 Tax=Chrysophaeum taylorii TaxID=2483200 RepID=A0AAD7UPL5_9STRA|nr:hypothetical protein CTAYLR_009795 [Chrysophaeum taylorii]
MKKKKTSATRDPESEAAALAAWGVGECVDIGANLQSRGDFGEVCRLVERAAVAGVSRVVLTGCDVEGSRKGAAYCEEWAARRNEQQRLYCTAGVHPHDAKDWDGDAEAAIREVARSPYCVALGETGLDYDRMFSPRETQLEVFRAQAELAKTLDMPLFVHCREKDEGEPLGAYADAVRILNEVGVEPAACCVHCFTGNSTELRLVREFGAYVGVTGFVGIAKRCGPTVEALRAEGPRILDALMIETDAPFMMPDKAWIPARKELGIRGGKNEPAALPGVARALAAALGGGGVVEPSHVAGVTTQNARRFFRWG